MNIWMRGRTTGITLHRKVPCTGRRCLWEKENTYKCWQRQKLWVIFWDSAEMAQFLLSTCSLSRRIKNFLLFPKLVVIKCHISRGVDILVRMTGIVFIILKDSAVMSDFIYLFIYCTSIVVFKCPYISNTYWNSPIRINKWLIYTV